MHQSLNRNINRCQMRSMCKTHLLCSESGACAAQCLTTRRMWREYGEIEAWLVLQLVVAKTPQNPNPTIAVEAWKQARSRTR